MKYDIWVLQLRSKKELNSIYFLQTLTKPSETPLLREHLSLNVPWFSDAGTQRNTIFGKIDSKKKKKKNCKKTLQ